MYRIQMSEKAEKSRQKKRNPLDLQSRLFDQGIGHSSISSFKSPLAVNSHRLLCVNFASNSKHSPKNLQKRTPFSPSSPANSASSVGNIKKYMIRDHVKTSFNFSHQKSLPDEEKTCKSPEMSNLQDSIVFKQGQLSIQDKQGNERFGSRLPLHSKESASNEASQSLSFTVKTAVSSKVRKEKVEECDSKVGGWPNCADSASVPASPKTKKLPSSNSEGYDINNEDISLEQYVSLALKNQTNLQQFLYLINGKVEKGGIEGPSYPDVNPYHLEIIQHKGSSIIPESFSSKYYTVSKKGLCKYVNGKPVEFIELEEWLAEKENYLRIKGLNFFNRFKRWKIVKMWRKIVLKTRIEECSRNLEDRLFFLNPTLRNCLFEIQSISLKVGRSMVIINQQEPNYNINNFRTVQEKAKKDISKVIQSFSLDSRNSVKKCFSSILEEQRTTIKSTEQTDDKITSIASQANAKDKAFQVLGFPRKMSYQNRSKLRKTAGKFIRFAYLIDLIHTTGLAHNFENELQNLIEELKKAQVSQPMTILSTLSDSETSPNQENPIRMFNVRLSLSRQQIPNSKITQILLRSDDSSCNFNPLHHIELEGSPLQNDCCDQQPPKYRQYCSSICEQWLVMKPTFENIYEELATHIKQSLGCLRHFERWSKHKDMDQYMDILEEWDDVVSQNRQTSENSNLEPSSIINSLDDSLTEIRSIINSALQTIRERLRAEMTEILNVFAETTKVDLNKFASENLANPAETIQSFLEYLAGQFEVFRNNIPSRIGYGIFELHLSSIREELLSSLTTLSEEFKKLLVRVVEVRKNSLNEWLVKYYEVIQQKPSNIETFVSKVRYVREIEHTFEHKKELCLNLSSIYQTMETHEINTLKRKEFEVVTLRLKDQLEQQLNTFDQTCEKQSEKYVKQIVKSYLPSIIRNAEGLSASINHPKFLAFEAAPEHSTDKTESYSTIPQVFENNERVNSQKLAEIVGELKNLYATYTGLETSNGKYWEYQQILNKYIAKDTAVPNEQSVKSIKSNWQLQNGIISSVESPIYKEHLSGVRDSIEVRMLLWQLYTEWSRKITDLRLMKLSEILEKRDQLSADISRARNSVSRRLIGNLPDNTVLQELITKIQLFETHFAIIVGLNGALNESHWEEIHELAQQIGVMGLDLKNYKNITFEELAGSGIGQAQEQLSVIFTKAANQIYLQAEYAELQRKWDSTIVRTKMETKYHIIISEDEQICILELFDATLRKLATIMSHPFSSKVRTVGLNYNSVVNGLEIFRLWLSTQKRWGALDKLCKAIDTKKLSEPNLIQSFDKAFKSVNKLLQSRNIENGFSLNRLTATGSHLLIDKLAECQKSLQGLENCIQQLLHEYRCSCQLFYQLSDQQILKMMTAESSGLSMGNLVSWLICDKLMPGTIEQVKFNGQRIVDLITFDGESVIKTPISLNAELEQIVEQITDSIGDVCRKLMRSCRAKNLEACILDIVGEYRLQFLLAITKVDFSNYTAISIQNQHENSDSLRDYLKILNKDTLQGIRKLKDGKNQIRDIYAYETILLQNLIHQKVLKGLIADNVACANQFSWVNELRFSWEDNGTNLEQTNICVKKMHVILRYGKQYIGSKARVVTSSQTQVMLAINHSETVFYDGAFERLEVLVNAIGHKIKRINCQLSTTANQLKNIIISQYRLNDCLLYLQNLNQLGESVLKQLMERSLFQSVQNSGVGSGISTTYNPVFLQMKTYINTQFDAYRSTYRIVSLFAPQIPFIEAHFELYQVNPGSGTVDFRTPAEMRILSGFIVRVIKKTKEFEGDIPSFCVENFLHTMRLEASSRLLHRISEEHEKQATNQSLQLNQMILSLFMNYLRGKVSPQTFALLLPYIEKVSEGLFPTEQCIGFTDDSVEQSATGLKMGTNGPKSFITLVTGSTDRIYPQNYTGFIGEREYEYVNLLQHTQIQLYGNEECLGLLDKCVHLVCPSYSDLGSRYCQILHKEIYDHKSRFNLNENNQILSSQGYSEKCLQRICEQIQPSSRSTPSPTMLIIEGINKRLINYLLELSHSQGNTRAQGNSLKIMCSEIGQFIDPRILIEFQIEHLPVDQSYIDWRLRNWLDSLQEPIAYLKPANHHQTLSFLSQCPLQGAQVMECIKNGILVFYQCTVKLVDSMLIRQKEDTKVLNHKLLVLREFTVFVSTLLPELIHHCVANRMEINYGNKSSNKDSDYQNFACSATIQACIYALSWVYEPIFSRHEFMKLQKVFAKLIGEELIADNMTIFDYVFDGRKLVPISQHFCLATEKLMETGHLYFSREFQHNLLVAERTLGVEGLALSVYGNANSGKSAFCSLYRSKHHEQTAYIRISLSSRRNGDKHNFYSRISSVVSAHDLCTIKAKLNYGRSAIIVDDVNMGSQNQQCQHSTLQFIRTMIGQNLMRIPSSVQKYRVQDVKFMICSREALTMFENCSVKCKLGESTRERQNHKLLTLFTQILNANVLDSQISIDAMRALVSSTLHIFIKLEQRLGSENSPNVSIIKQMATFTAHLCFRQTPTLSPEAELQKFWAYNLKARLSPYIHKMKQEEKFPELEEVVGCVQPMYSHLHIKQEKHSKGKQLQQVLDLNRLQDIINNRINKYNQLQHDDILKKYGSNFQFVAMKDFLAKLIKMSNLVLDQDYVMFGRKGSEQSAMVRLVSYLLDFDYQLKSQELSLLETIKEAIPDLVKTSSYLIHAKITQRNLWEFIEYCDSDFQAEVVGIVWANSLANNKTRFSNCRPTQGTVEVSSSTNISSDCHGTMKPSKQEILNIQRSIRLVYEFNDYSLLHKPVTHSSHIPSFIKSQLCLDFFEEYPEESVLRLGQEILEINLVDFCGVTMKEAYIIYQSLRSELGLSIKEYDESIKQYSSLISYFHSELETCLNKLTSVMDLEEKLGNILNELCQQIDCTHEEKKSSTAALQAAKESAAQTDPQPSQQLLENIENLEHKIGTLTTELQIQTQTRSQCEKIIKYLSPSMPKYAERINLLLKLQGDPRYLRHVAMIIACYFTYLSWFPFTERKSRLAQWYQLEGLKQVPPQQQITSISQLFYLIRDEEMILNQDNEPMYENMTIILETIKPVLIRDVKGLGTQWLQEFDPSFVVLSESECQFQKQLTQYLSAGHNILLQVASQLTLNSIQSSWMKSLVCMPEGTTSLSIKGEEVQVSKESKVFIVVGPGLQVSEEAANLFIQVSYEQSMETHLEAIEQELMIAKNNEKFQSYWELKKKRDDIVRKCQKFENGITESIWEEFYPGPKEPEDQNQEPVGPNLPHKTEHEIRECLSTFNKDLINKIQQYSERLNAKKKLVPELDLKVQSALPTTPEITQIKSAVLALSKVLKKMMPQWQKNSQANNEIFMQTIVQAIKRGYLDNIGTLIVFALKEWGQRFSRQNFLVFGLLMIITVQGGTDREVIEFCANVGKTGSTPSSSSELLNKLCLKATVNDGYEQSEQFMLSIESLEKLIIESILTLLERYQTPFATISTLCESQHLSSSIQHNLQREEHQQAGSLEPDSSENGSVDLLLRNLVILTGRPLDPIPKEQAIAEPTHRCMVNNIAEVAYNNNAHGPNSLKSNSVHSPSVTGQIERVLAFAQQLWGTGCSVLRSSENLESDLKKAMVEGNSVLVMADPIAKSDSDETCEQVEVHRPLQEGLNCNCIPSPPTRRSPSIIKCLFECVQKVQYNSEEQPSAASKVEKIANRGNLPRLHARKDPVSKEMGQLAKEQKYLIYHPSVQDLTRVISQCLRVQQNFVKQRVSVNIVNLANNQVVLKKLCKQWQIRSHQSSQLNTKQSEGLLSSQHSPPDLIVLSPSCSEVEHCKTPNLNTPNQSHVSKQSITQKDECVEFVRNVSHMFDQKLKYYNIFVETSQHGTSEGFFSGDLITGVQRVRQSISNENEGWQPTHDARLLCQYFLQAACTNLKFAVFRQEWAALLSRVIKKVEHVAKEDSKNISLKQHRNLITSAIWETLFEDNKQIDDRMKHEVFTRRKEAFLIVSNYTWLNRLRSLVGEESYQLDMQAPACDRSSSCNQLISIVHSYASKTTQRGADDPNKSKSNIDDKAGSTRQQDTAFARQMLYQQIKGNELVKMLVVNYIKITHDEISGLNQQSISEKFGHILQGVLMAHDVMPYECKNLIQATSRGTSRQSDRAQTHHQIMDMLIRKSKAVAQQIKKVAQIGHPNVCDSDGVNLSEIDEPLLYIRAHFCDEFTGDSRNGYFTITNSLSEEERTGKYLKVEHLYSKGWKLGTEGYLDQLSTTANESGVKIFTNHNVYIVKRKKPQQLAICRIKLVEDESDLSQPTQAIQNVGSTTEPPLILYASTKRVLKTREASFVINPNRCRNSKAACK